MVVDASCADGACSGERMATGAKVRGLQATVVNSTVRDLAQVRSLGYPLFGTHASPVGTTRKKEPEYSQMPLTLGRVSVNPEDIMVGGIDGVLVIAKEFYASSETPEEIKIPLQSERNRVNQIRKQMTRVAG